MLLLGDGKLLKVLSLMGLYPQEMPFVEYFEQIKAEARLLEQYRSLHWEQTGELL